MSESEKKDSSQNVRKWKIHATVRMFAGVKDGQLTVKFKGSNQLRSWVLPSKDDIAAIRDVRDKAIRFAKDNGCTEGQIGALRKALSDNGYYIRKPSGK